MGILPLQFAPGENRNTLELDGSEKISLLGLTSGVNPGMTVTVRIMRMNDKVDQSVLVSRIDTQNEAAYYRHGGILQYMLRQMSG